MPELWKTIDGYQGLYMVSNTGKVKSLRWNHSNIEKELTQYDQGGYKLVGIRRGGIHHNHLVHRLVAKAFVENPRNLSDVNHIDGNKSNNNAYNLEWVTKSENIQHAIKLGLRPPICKVIRKSGKDSPLCKKIVQYDSAGNLLRVWNSSFEIEEVLGFSRRFVQRCCVGERKTYQGFIWKHLDRQRDTKNKKEQGR